MPLFEDEGHPQHYQQQGYEQLEAAILRNGLA